MNLRITAKYGREEWKCFHPIKVEKNRPQAEFEEEREIMKGKEQGKDVPLLFLTSQLIFWFCKETLAT